MNLIEIYDSLPIPEKETEGVFNAQPIPDYSNCRIAIDFQGNPVLLLSARNLFPKISFNNFRLKHLQINQNLECKIRENNKSTFQTFTAVTFINADRPLQEYFLIIAESLKKAFQDSPTQEKISETINKFIEVFRLLGDISRNTVQGL